MSLCPVDHKQCQCSGTAADPCRAVEALRKDAERYRWLRARPLDDDEIYIAVDSARHAGRWALGGSDPDGCDAAIDAAMAAPTALGAA